MFFYRSDMLRFCVEMLLPKSVLDREMPAVTAASHSVRRPYSAFQGRPATVSMMVLCI